MKLIPQDYKTCMKVTIKRSDNYGTLKEFCDMGVKCAEVANYTQKNARSCNASLTASISRYKMSHIKCRLVGGKVYLINNAIK